MADLKKGGNRQAEGPGGKEEMGCPLGEAALPSSQAGSGDPRFPPDQLSLLPYMLCDHKAAPAPFLTPTNFPIEFCRAQGQSSRRWQCPPWHRL